MTYKFEDKIEIINNELKKRKPRWRLKAVTDIDFDDVQQIIRIHIYNKWDKWDQEKPLEPWLNKIITHQMRNVLRNKYYRYARPCLGMSGGKACVYNEGGDLCGLTPSGKQCSECVLFAKWEKRKRWSHEAHIPVSLSNHENTIEAATENNYMFCSTEMADNLHAKMKDSLPEQQYKIYEMLYVKNMDDDEVAQILGYIKKLDKKRKAVRYKQLEVYKKQFLKIAANIVREEGVE